MSSATVASGQPPTGMTRGGAHGGHWPRVAKLSPTSLVGVAQLVELRVVVSAVAGSNPVAHHQKGISESSCIA